jgi:hypothetical protein
LLEAGPRERAAFFRGFRFVARTLGVSRVETASISREDTGVTDDGT